MLAAAQDAPGLIIMLEAAGRTIAGLEARVEQLDADLVAERQERAALEDLLVELRTQPDDSASVRPSAFHDGETVPHDLAAPDAVTTAPALA